MGANEKAAATYHPHDGPQLDPAQIEAAARAVDTWTAERLDFVLSSAERDSLARAALTAAAQEQPECDVMGCATYAQCPHRAAQVQPVGVSSDGHLCTMCGITHDRSQPAPVADDREALRAFLHRRHEFDHDACDHGTFIGGPSHGQPYAICEREAAALLAEGYRRSQPAPRTDYAYCPVHGDLLAGSRSLRCAEAEPGHEFAQSAPRTVSAALDRLAALGSEITPEMEDQSHRVLWVNLRTDLRNAVTDLRAALGVTVEAPRD